MPEMITETVSDSDVINGSNRIIDMIADLQAVLARIPEEFRSEATIVVEAYDWEGSHVQYERPITDAEIADRAARIEAQRQRVGDKIPEEWLRNVRLNVIEGRDEAAEFIRTNQEANKYHPDVWPPTPEHPAGYRPWAAQAGQAITTSA